jgi:dTDP-4-amino-4,6-dideoxygalactose transaminase
MGTRLQGVHVGTVGRWGCVSLNGNKIITAGSGGLILCKNASDATYLRHLSRQAKIPNSAYAHDLIGYNYRMPDLCAALALAQFEKLDDFIQKKQNIMHIYRNELAALQWQDYAQGDAPNAWLNVCKVPLRDTWIQTLRSHNISASEVWMPLHTQPQFKQAICIGNGNEARDLYAHALSIPGSVTLTLPQQMKIVKILRELISIAG